MLTVSSAILGTLWYAAVVTGVGTWIAAVVLVFSILRVGKSISELEEHGYRSVEMPYDVYQDYPVVQSMPMPDAQGSPYPNMAVQDWLDDAIDHRARLSAIYRTLCTRCGVDSESSGPIQDMICAAVFDGRDTVACANKIEAIIGEKRSA